MTVKALVATILTIAAVGAISPVQAQSRQHNTPSLQEHVVMDNFENGIYRSWSMKGDCWGNCPEGNGFGGARFSGWSGSYYLSSAHPRIGDTKMVTGTGEATTAEFKIAHKELRFKIGGGNYPGQCAINLLVKDADGVEQVVRTQTGNDSDRLDDASWDLTDLVGKKAHLQLVDKLAFGSRAYLLVDDIELVGLAARPAPASVEEPTTTEPVIRTGPILQIEGKLPAPRPTRPTIVGSTAGTFTLPDGTKVSGKALTLEATGYGPGENGPWGDRTALGTKVGYGTVAVDPKVIPLRSRLWVEGYGFCTALDTGSAIKGMRIDLAHNDDVTANQYGRKKVKVIVLD